MNKNWKLLFFINFCLSNFLMSAKLNYGDAICLYLNRINTFFLSTKTTPSGYIPAALKFNLVNTNESIKFYIQPGRSDNRLDGCGSNNQVKSGDIIRLETSTLSKTNNPSYLAYDYSSGMTAESNPKLYQHSFEEQSPYSLSPNVSGYLFKIFKINQTVDTISEGDSVVLVAYYKNSSTFIPFYLGAKEDVTDNNKADLIFASSMTSDNPSNFPLKYSWFVSTIIANAYISDALDNKKIVNKDNSELTANNPSGLSNVILNPIPKIPLRYGDGFVLKHKTHGTYLSITGGRDSSVVAKPSLDVGSSWLAEVGNEMPDWGIGNNKLGITLKSGDYLRMGNFDFFGGQGSRDFRMYMSGFSRPQPSSIASSPNPPYGRLSVYDHKFGACTRIYKYNSNVGDPIYKGDDVYIYSFYQYNYYRAEPPTDQYLGSANNATGSNKEVFVYQSRPCGRNLPPNFTTQYLWIIDDVYPDSYKNKPTSGSWSGAIENSNFPPIADRQF